MPSRQDALTVLAVLADNNIRSVIIGSLSGCEQSEHDIDILILDHDTPELLQNLKLMFPHVNCVRTDWMGLYLHGSDYGDLDFFFIDRLFDLAIAPDRVVDHNNFVGTDADFT